MVCKNCNTSLNSHNKFCPECGAKVIHNRLTLKHIFIDFTEQFFNYDNKILNTFIHLFTKPEYVIGGFIDGVRKRHLNVVQYFIISLSLTGLSFFILNSFFENPFDFDSSFGFDNPNLKNPETIQKSKEDLEHFMSNYYSLLYIFSIPFSAIASWITMYLFDKRYNYTEHIIINTYYAAQLLVISAVVSVIFAIAGINYLNFSMILTPFLFLYFGYIVKRMYNLSIKKSILCLITYLFFYSVVFGVLLIVGTIIGVIIALKQSGKI